MVEELAPYLAIDDSDPETISNASLSHDVMKEIQTLYASSADS